MIQEKIWLTPYEAAKYLGVHVNTIYTYLKQKDNPLPRAYLSPRIIRINKNRLEEWIKTYNLEDK